MLIFQPLYLAVTSIILPKFEPRSFLAAIQNHKANISFVAPPILLFFANAPVVNEFNLSSLRLMMSAAAPLSVSLIDRVLTRINKRPGHKVGITQGFGITELSPASHGTPISRQDKAYSVGLLLPNLEARLVDEDGSDVEKGNAGEMYIRGPTVMKCVSLSFLLLSPCPNRLLFILCCRGYLNKPAATRSSITDDGWFKTGDIAIRDEEGYYSIVDRKKELIKYKGFQVAPAELENVLITHPAIVDAGVIGVYDSNVATEFPRFVYSPLFRFDRISDLTHLLVLMSYRETLKFSRLPRTPRNLGLKWPHGSRSVFRIINNSAAGSSSSTIFHGQLLVKSCAKSCG